MRPLIFTLICLSCFTAVMADPGPRPKVATAAAESKAALVNAGEVRFQFNNLVSGMEEKDSILIIFDRCDHTGAGVVYQKFAADGEHGVTLPAVPAGKYFVTIQCVGLHHDRLEKVVTIKSQKSEKVRIELQHSEEFCKDDVRIPAYHPDFSDMSVAKRK
jgi:hypothetical protein